MAITDTDINNAVPAVGPATPDESRATMRLLNALLKALRDEAASGSGGEWGQISGDINQQTDLIIKLSQKFNVPAGTAAQYVRGNGTLAAFPALAPVATTSDYNDLINRPDLSALDGISPAPDFASLPAMGDTGTLYITQDDGKLWRWDGTQYVDVSTSLARWGSIQGTLSNQTDIKNALDGKMATPLGGAGDYLDGQGAVKPFPNIPEGTSDLVNDAGFATTALRWMTIDDDITLTAFHNGATFLITDDATITIDDALPAGWNVAFVPDDSKDSTSHTATLAFVGSGHTIGNLTKIKGVCSLSLTPTADLFAAAGAIES